MSLIASSPAVAALPSINPFAHGAKKVAHGADSAASSATQGAASTQSLFSSLLQSVEQVIGVSLTAPAANATAGALGVNVNTKA